MHKETVGDREYLVGDADVIIGDLPIRVKVFCEDVMGKNLIRKRKTSEEYLTKMATALIYRLMPVSGAKELINQILESALKYEYMLCYFKCKLFMYYCARIIEMGYEPEDPYEDFPERQFKNMYQKTEVQRTASVFMDL